METKNNIKTIILVYNDKITLKLLKELCLYIHADVKVEMYLNAEQAAQRLSQNNYNLLITGYKLNNKHIDGIDLAKISWAMGKHSIIISQMFQCVWIKLVLFNIKMLSRVKVLNRPIRSNKFVNEIVKRIDDSINVLDMFDIIKNY